MNPFNDSKLRMRPDSGGADGAAARHQRLLDEIRRNTIVSVGPGIRLISRANGKHLALTKYPKDFIVGLPSSAQPFEVFVYPAGTDTGEGWTGWRNVRVHRGLINETHPDNDAEGSTPLDILVPASTTDYKLYLEVLFTLTPACVDANSNLQVTANSIKYGAGWWSGHAGEFPSAGKFYMEIATVTTGVDTPDTDPNYRAITITQIATEDRILIFPNTLVCTTANDGGSAGDASTNCSFTYKCTDFCGNVILAGATPQQKRIDKTKYETESGKGLLYLNASGQYELMYATGERPIDPTAC